MCALLGPRHKNSHISSSMLFPPDSAKPGKHGNHTLQNQKRGGSILCGDCQWHFLNLTFRKKGTAKSSDSQSSRLLVNKPGVASSTAHRSRQTELMSNWVKGTWLQGLRSDGRTEDSASWRSCPWDTSLSHRGAHYPAVAVCAPENSSPVLPDLPISLQKPKLRILMWIFCFLKFGN